MEQPNPTDPPDTGLEQAPRGDSVATNMTDEVFPNCSREVRQEANAERTFPSIAACLRRPTELAIEKLRLWFGNARWETFRLMTELARVTSEVVAAREALAPTVGLL
jgi:hypothetical protein